MFKFRIELVRFFTSDLSVRTSKKIKKKKKKYGEIQGVEANEMKFGARFRLINSAPHLC